MKIDDNSIEIKAMEAFHAGDSKEGHRLQDEFLSLFHESVRCGEDYCPCTDNCKHHGRCMECVVIHRGHDDHLPYCMHVMLNRRLAKLSELSEHTVSLEKIK